MDTLKAMSIFCAVKEEGSMSGAARRLGIVNSVVTKNINELEEWLGRKLVYRSTRGISISQEGFSYYKKIKYIIDGVSALERVDDIDSKELAGSIKVTAPVALDKSIICARLTDFRNQYPHIDVSLDLNNNFSDIVDEGYDVAVRVGQLSSSRLIARKLTTVRIKLISSLSYIKEFGAPSNPQALVQHACLIDSSISDAKRWTFNDREGVKFNVRVDGPFTVNSAECIVHLAESGMGIAWLPDFFVRKSIKEGKLIELLPEYSLSVDLSLLYHKKGANNPATNAFIHYLAGCFDS